MEHLSYLTDLKIAIELANFQVIVQIQPICPWGGFTHALNIALRIAIDEEYSRIMYMVCYYFPFLICYLLWLQSFEVDISQSEVDILASHMDENTLVVGPVLEGHEFVLGTKDLAGRNCPWNTCAVWACGKLGLIGFPLIGDGYGTDIPGGVEVSYTTIWTVIWLINCVICLLLRLMLQQQEVTAIAMAQMLNCTWTAKLIDMPAANNDHNGTDTSSVKWNTTFEDETRQTYHEKKMASKNSRPAAQMLALGSSVNPGQVIHISHHQR
jgi:hypothetical protein